MKAKTEVTSPEMNTEWYLRLEKLLLTVGIDDVRLMTEFRNKIRSMDQNSVYNCFRTSSPEFKERFPSFKDFQTHRDSFNYPDEINYDYAYEDPLVKDIDLKGWYGRCGVKPHPAYFLLPTEKHEDLTREEKVELTRLANGLVGKFAGSMHVFVFAKKAKFQGAQYKQSLFSCVPIKVGSDE